MPASVARYLINLGFSDADRARLHHLALRNQEDGLSPAEKEELFAYVKSGSLISILKSRARRILRMKRRKGTR